MMTANDIALLKEARAGGYSRIDSLMPKFDTEEARMKAEAIAFKDYRREHCREF